MRCLLLRRKKKNIILYITLWLHGKNFINGPRITTYTHMYECVYTHACHEWMCVYSLSLSLSLSLSRSLSFVASPRECASTQGSNGEMIKCVDTHKKNDLMYGHTNKKFSKVSALVYLLHKFHGKYFWANKWVTLPICLFRSTLHGTYAVNTLGSPFAGSWPSGPLGVWGLRTRV